MKVYLLDGHNCFAGEAVVEGLGPLPRCVSQPPPALEGAQVAQWMGGGWVVMPEHPDKGPSREDVWLRIRAERDRRNETGGFAVSVDGAVKWFHSDTKSRTQQIGLVMMGPAIPEGLRWKTMDGSFVHMTPALAQAVFYSAAAQDQATFVAAEAHRAAMEAAPDPGVYDFSGGWPAVFGDA